MNVETVESFVTWETH